MTSLYDRHKHLIIIGDNGYECSARVLTWHETGMEFKAGQGFNKKREQQIDLSVFHWSGGEGPTGEGSIRQLFDILLQKKLGTGFAISRDGMIWQFCDPMKVNTATANQANPRAVSTEIINYGLVPKNLADIPKAGVNRKQYTGYINTQRHVMAHFIEPQIASALALADTLSTVLAIPRQVPLDPLSPHGTEILSRTMTPEELAAYKGHTGHFHINPEKTDPGLDLLEVFRICWSTSL